MGVTGLCVWLSWQPKPRVPEIGELAGQVYVTTNRQLADYRVAKIDEATPSYLRVFEEQMVTSEKLPGRWYFTNSLAAADFTIYWEDQPAFADFTVTFTPFWDEAGCP